MAKPKLSKSLAPIPPEVARLFPDAPRESDAQSAPWRRVDTKAAILEGLGLASPALEHSLSQVTRPSQLHSMLRGYDLDPAIRAEILTRALIYFRTKAKESSMSRPVFPALSKSARPPAGYSAIPGGQKGGFRKKTAKGWAYWYADGASPSSAPSYEARQRLYSSMEGPWQRLEDQALAGEDTSATVAKVKALAAKAVQEGHTSKTLKLILSQFSPASFPSLSKDHSVYEKRERVRTAMRAGYSAITSAIMEARQAQRSGGLKKAALGGRYYKRVPTGNPKRPYRYYYSKQAYVRHLRDKAHISGRETLEQRRMSLLTKAVHKRDTLANAHGDQIPKSEAQRVWVKGTDFGLPAQTVKAHAKKAGKDQWGDDAYEFSAERSALHDSIVSDATSKVPVVAANKTPTAVVMMGGGGSGKGTVLKAVLHEQGDFVHVDSDEFKKRLPEYQKAMNLGSVGTLPVTAKDAAWMAHEESGVLAEKATAAAIAQNKNLILDGTGKNQDKMVATLRRMKAAGYHVHLIYAHAEKGDAVERAAGRADRSGRYVPLAVLEDAHSKIPQNFDPVSKFADRYDVMMSRPPPHPPHELLTGPPEQVLDEDRTAAFRETAEKLQALQMLKSEDQFLDALSVIAPEPSVPHGEILRRIAAFAHHYPAATTDENYTADGGDLLRADAMQIRAGSALA